MNDDRALVQEFARNNSEQAFATLVERHVSLVYSVALRRVGEPHLAQDITQGVFIILAKKAKSLGPKTILPGWLCRTARYVSSHAIRTQKRRHAREQEVHMQSMTNEPDADAWKQIAPMLDEALGSLTQPEHDAVVLRFFEGKPFAEVGAAIGTTEDSARMRVSRAVDKLRGFFSKKGVVLSAAVLTGAAGANSVHAAPAGLATAVTAAAVKGTAVSATITTFVNSTMKTMTWLKLKLAIGIGVAALVAGGGVMAVLSAESAKPSVQDAQEEPVLIVPKMSVGKVVRGMTTNEVEAVLGKPDKWVGKMMVYDKRYGMSVAQSSNGVAAILCGDSMLKYPGVANFKGRTKEGIGMKSSQADVTKAFGKPTGVGRSKNGGVQQESMLYQELGMSFTLEEGKVIHILVNFRPITLQTNLMRLKPNTKNTTSEKRGVN